LSIGQRVCEAADSAGSLGYRTING
jgi:hypothetical protein